LLFELFADGDDSFLGLGESFGDGDA
jgi:hypothetical protein